MEKGALFDTNILIDFLNEVPEAAEEFGRYDRRVISQVTWIEVMAGVMPDDDSKTRGFLDTFEVVGLTQSGLEDAVELRRGRKYKLPDVMILATALSHLLLLVTRNTRDFTEGPFVRVPYKI